MHLLINPNDRYGTLHFTHGTELFCRLHLAEELHFEEKAGWCILNKISGSKNKMPIRMFKSVKKAVRKVAQHYGYDVVPYWQPVGRDEALNTPPARPEFQGVQFAEVAIQKLLDEYAFDTVLDIGCGAGEHSEVFLKYGKEVTAIDYGNSVYFQRNQGRPQVIIGDFNTMQLPRQFDCVWASHVLEHQLNVGSFLTKVYTAAKEGGVVCLTVPPLQAEILGGHVSFWNAGVLLYNMILAGFDCHDAHILRYGYNISVIVKKKTAVLPELAFDKGDVDRISAFLPAGFKEGFNGDIWWLNW